MSAFGGNFVSVSDMDRNTYSESTSCLEKYCFCRKKIIIFPLGPKTFDTKKKP